MRSALLLMLLSLAALVAACEEEEAAPEASPATSPAASPEAGASPVQTTVPDLTAFLKQWERHGFSLTVHADGQGSAEWRVYKWCSDDPTPPCDTIVNNVITGGGSATLVFSRVDGETAYGEVIESSDPATLSPGPVSLTLLPYDMARLSQGSMEIDLCGPDFAQLAPESVQSALPCGA